MTLGEALNLVNQLGEAMAKLSPEDRAVVEAAIENEVGANRLKDKLSG